MHSTTPLYKTVSILLVSLIGSVWFGSCTNLRNEVDPSLLGVQPTQLVVSSFLSPQDTILAVKVTRSNTVVGDSVSLLQTGNLVTDATVTLSDGSKSVVLPYNNRLTGDTTRNQTYYSINARSLPIIVGRTYTLTVVATNGQRASSTCTIPTAVPPTAIVPYDTGKAGQRPYVLVNWQDPAGQPNYYQVNGIFRYISATCKACQNETYNTLSFDDDKRGLFPDAGLDGTKIESGKAYLTFSSASNLLSQYRTARITVNLMSVDQNYYQFQEAVIRQRRSRNNPFAEPVLIPSNIQGGLGCFAGYTNATLTLKLK